MLGLDVCEFGGQVLELLWLTMCYRGLMAEKEAKSICEEEEDEVALNYTPPAQKSLDEIKELDKEDESLNKYKQTLLGAVPIVADLSLPNVQVTRLTLMCEQAPNPITMDLTVDKARSMVGSYGPRTEEHEFMTPVEEAPKGMLVRGNYHIKSCFTDDDKTSHLSWEWNLNIKKDWNE
ncbi:hypothetical protein CRUP_022258 [Coryphaenoides rupestris]|nr:hypothetical protein CRUP_022258 [Coryphaenoides rupestris]